MIAILGVMIDIPITRRATPRTRPGRRPLGLALQGGGAHGAFTWGVLDRLLEADRHDIQAITGTSAGAVNAVALASGLVSGGADGARDTLAAVWSDVGSQYPMDLMLTGSDDRPSLNLLAKAALSMSMTLSPTQLNPWGLDPLRTILARHIDIERLRSDRSAPAIHLAATHATTGRLRMFTNDDLTLDSVLASACLPSLQQPVQIDGEPYWDGGYCANPPLQPLVADGRRDALLVLIVPTSHAGTPARKSEIAAREEEFAFTTAFLRECEILATATERARQAKWPFMGDLERSLRRMRWHLIDAAPHIAALDPQTRVITHLPFLKSLRDAGRSHAGTWLGEYGNLIGVRSTADLHELRSLAA